MSSADASVEVEPGRIRSKKEIEIIKSFKVPEFNFPYPNKLNPNAEKAIADARRWIEDHKLAELYQDSTVQTIINTNAAVLPPRIYIDAGEEELAWICKYYIWMFVVDDQIEDDEYFLNPEKAILLYLELNLVILWSFPDDKILLSNLQQFYDQAPVDSRESYVDYVEAKLAKAKKAPGTVYDASKLGSICTSFVDLWTTLLKAKRPGFCLRWGRSVQKILMGNLDETVIRMQNYIPSVAEYIPIRRNAGTMESLTVIIEYADHVDIPDELFNTPEMQELLVAVNDIINWHNDIWSFKKEMLKGDVHNLVYLISFERKCSYAEASKVVVQMLMDRIDEMERVSAALLELAPTEDKSAVLSYSKHCGTFVSGAQYWYIGNKRYNF